MSESLVERARRRREELGLTEGSESVVAPTRAPKANFDDDLIPALDGDAARERDADDRAIDDLLDGFSILDAYRRWCGKMEPKVGKRRESVMVSCPNPSHRDSNPSAWLNLDKNVWFCGACNEGGDHYDLGAWWFGHDVPSYKTDGSFPALRREMAEDLGYVVVTNPTSGKSTFVKPVEDDQDDDQEGDSEQAPTDDDAPLAPVLRIAPEPEPPRVIDPIGWREIFPNDTFLRQWMDVCAKDDLPEEFYFWLGLVAVGFAAGDDAVLQDSPMVKGNLFVCLYGPTGIGKSRATRALEEVLRKALPYEVSDPYSKGVCQIAQPASAEALLDNFSKPEYDPTDPTKIVRYHQVRGLLKVDELSDIMGRAARSGSVIKPLLMRLYDGYGDIDHRSRGHGYVKAEKPYCSTVTTTQPKAIRDLLVQVDADSGFVNRWVFAAGTPKPLVPIGRAPLDIDSVVPALQRLRTWCSGGRTVNLGTEAQAMWEEFFRSKIEPMKLSNDATLMTRTDLTLKKLMLLLSVDDKDTIVTAERMERVLRLWNYLHDTYQSLSDEIGVGPFEECRSALLEVIRAWGHANNGEPIKLREVSRQMGEQGYDREMVMRALQNLERLDEIAQHQLPAKKGQTSELFAYSALA